MVGAAPQHGAESDRDTTYGTYGRPEGVRNRPLRPSRGARRRLRGRRVAIALVRLYQAARGHAPFSLSLRPFLL